MKYVYNCTKCNKTIESIFKLKYCECGGKLEIKTVIKNNK